MDFFEIIDKRHSVRRFTGEKVSSGDIVRILKAALSAPSSKNSRSTGLMVVETTELLEKMSVMRDSGSSFLKHAPLAIVVMGDETVSDLWLDNAAISATVIQLAAVALGLGSCWVHVNGRPRKKDDPSAGFAEDYLKTFLPIPSGRRVLCAIALGHPDPEANTLPHPEFDPSKIIKA